MTNPLTKSRLHAQDIHEIKKLIKLNRYFNTTPSKPASYLFKAHSTHNPSQIIFLTLTEDQCLRTPDGDFKQVGAIECGDYFQYNLDVIQIDQCLRTDTAYRK